MTEISTSILPTDDTGDGVSGTILNRAYMAAFKAAIDVLIHSAANPTITPEDIIDEVKTARGSKTNLNARLSVALNADGTLIFPKELYTIKWPIYQENSGSNPTDVAGAVDLLLPDDNGDFLEYEVYGTFAANANNKKVEYTIDGVTYTVIPVGAHNNKFWHFRVFYQNNASTLKRGGIIFPFLEGSSLTPIKIEATPADIEDIFTAYITITGVASGDIRCNPSAYKQYRNPLL